MSIQEYLGPPAEATLPGYNEPISEKALREAQISLCQHAPAVTKGVDLFLDIKIQWFEVTQELRFREPEELAVGDPFPNYRQMIAHLHIVNRRIQDGEPVPEVFQGDRDIITAVRLRSDVLWLDMAVTDGFVSFTCLGPTNRKLDPGRILLFAA